MAHLLLLFTQVLPLAGEVFRGLVFPEALHLLRFHQVRLHLGLVRLSILLLLRQRLLDAADIQSSFENFGRAFCIASATLAWNSITSPWWRSRIFSSRTAAFAS